MQGHYLPQGRPQPLSSTFHSIYYSVILVRCGTVSSKLLTAFLHILQIRMLLEAVLRIGHHRGDTAAVSMS